MIDQEAGFLARVARRPLAGDTHGRMSSSANRSRKRELRAALVLAPTLAMVLVFGDAAQALRCRTIERRNHPRVLAQHARPAAAISAPSALGYPFLVHGPAGSETLLARIRDAADRAWRAEIAEGVWPRPAPDRGGPDDRFDLYIDTSLGEGEAYVEGEDAAAGEPFDSSTSFMGLPTQFADDLELFSIVAHELNHGSQYAIDPLEDDAFFEHTAVFVERRVAAHVPTYGVGIADFQRHPERPLDYLYRDDYEYGAALWLMFLSEHLDAGGEALVRRLWQDSRQRSAVPPANEPDFLDALDGILAERRSDRAHFFATFASWRYFTGPRDDGRHFQGGAA